MLYNNCWHGFWVRSWWPRVLWQAVMLWLVNRGMAVRRGWPVEQVCNRKKTTWYENHTVRFRQSVQSESRVEPGIRSRSEVLVSSLMMRSASGCKRWHPLAPGRRYGARSLHLSHKLTTKLCAPFENKLREIYFYKEVCFVSFIEVRSLSSIMFLVGSMISIQHNHLLSHSEMDIYTWVSS